MSELSKRILVAVPAAAIFIWLTWLGGWYFKGMVILISMFIQHEIIKIMDHAHSPVDYLFPYTVALWVLLSNQIPFAFEIGLVIFVLFMYLIECLVAFLQAYIFTLLTSLFIGLATTEHH